MAWDKREVIGLLRLEIENIRRRGFSPVFRDSVLCINAGTRRVSDDCEQCLLMQFVPSGVREAKLPCHHIPLNEAGDTVASLQEKGAYKELQAALLSWLEAASARLEKELQEERAAKAG